jgi:hypothetical protein
MSSNHNLNRIKEIRSRGRHGRFFGTNRRLLIRKALTPPPTPLLGRKVKPILGDT